MPFTNQTHPEIPLDGAADAHGQTGLRLKAGDFISDPRVRQMLDQLGHSGEWTSDDSLYAVTHAAPGGGSLMARINLGLEQFGYFDSNGESIPTEGYPGKPTREEMLKLLEEFSQTTATSGKREQDQFIAWAYDSKLTAANIEAWMLAERGIVRQPGWTDTDPAAKGAFRAYETALAEWGYAATTGATAEVVEEKRAVFVAAGEALAAMVTGPGAEGYGGGSGDYSVNRRRVKYRFTRVQDQGVAGSATYTGPTNALVPYAGDPVRSASEAAQKMGGLAGVLDIPTRYDGLLGSQVILDWSYYRAQTWDGTRYVLDPRWTPEGGSSEGIGIR